MSIDHCNHVTEQQTKETVENFVTKRDLKSGFFVFVCCKNCKFELSLPKSDSAVRICKCIVICLE